MEKINPNTLRVGNLLIDQEGRYGIVTEIRKDGFECEPWPDNYEERRLKADRPAPITEEWIAKYAGPDESPQLGEHTKTHYLHFPFFHRLTVKTDGEIRLYAPNNDYKSVKFVHQLQNLYFALNEVELPLE